MTRWIRNRPDRQDDWVAGLAAGVAGAVVGAAVFWLVRLVGAREPLPEREGVERSGGSDEGGGAGLDRTRERRRGGEGS